MPRPRLFQRWHRDGTAKSGYFALGLKPGKFLCFRARVRASWLVMLCDGDQAKAARVLAAEGEQVPDLASAVEAAGAGSDDRRWVAEGGGRWGMEGRTCSSLRKLVPRYVPIVLAKST
eukprot:COSAG01_NODE_5870_length_3980_cov_35.431847_3_plen_118_part_00